MKKLIGAALVSMAWVAVAADDLKPAQEEAKEKFDTEIAASVTAMNEKCGTKVTVKSDFQNFKASDWENVSFPSFCTSATDAITALCEARPAYKKALAKKLTGVSCLFGGAKPAQKGDSSKAAVQRNMTFEKGVFTYTMAPTGQSNITDNAKEVLEKALN